MSTPLLYMPHIALTLLGHIFHFQAKKAVHSQRQLQRRWWKLIKCIISLYACVCVCVRVRLSVYMCVLDGYVTVLPMYRKERRRFGRDKHRWWPSLKCSVAICQIENTKMKASWQANVIEQWTQNAGLQSGRKVNLRPRPCPRKRPRPLISSLSSDSDSCLGFGSLSSHARHLLVMAISGCKMARLHLALANNNVATNSLISNVPTKWTWATTKPTQRVFPPLFPSIYGCY